MDQEAATDLWPFAELVRRAGLIQGNPPVEVRAFGGGISCIVALVSAGEGAWVVKQALPQLRVKDPWFADRRRIFSEVACLKLIRERIGGRPAPAVIFEDRQNFTCVLEYAGDGSRNWKQELLEGKADSSVTERVASVLAEIHKKTRGDKEARKTFGDDSNFHQLRLDPYLETTASRHPDLRVQIDEVSRFLAAKKVCLVHGDFSPKNILLLPDGRVWVIDCEVAHYGNPVFDVAFCTNHLILKSIHLESAPHLALARALWLSYWRMTDFTELEGEAVRTLAALMLARVDGKSPVEYLSDGERAYVRTLARRFIGEREESFAAVVSAVGERVGRGRSG